MHLLQKLEPEPIQKHDSLKLLVGIPSIRYVLWESSLEILAETTDGFICLSNFRDSVLRHKSYKYSLPTSRE